VLIVQPDEHAHQLSRLQPWVTRAPIPSRHRVGDLLQRYADEVSVGKRGERWERLRIGLICRDEVARVPLSQLSATDIAGWRDRRLGAISGSSVCRELNLLSHACSVAVREWRWLRENPCSGVRRPQAAPPRERRIHQVELDRLLVALGYDRDEPPESPGARVGAALAFAVETAMRAGEICGLTWDRIDMDSRTARLDRTKNGSARTVPLSTEAARILRQVMDCSQDDPVFGLTTERLSAIFRKARMRAGLDDIHFHDSRAEALTRLSQRVDVLTLARISGHRDLRQLQVYYRETPEEIAKRLG